MNLLNAVCSRFRSLWQRPAVKREIDEELRYHIEQRAAENAAAGMSPEEAAIEAQKRFGNFQSVREECRDVRGASLGEAAWQDIRFGLRMLGKNSGFTVAAVLTLALGIGACTAIFNVVNAVLLQRLSYSRPEELVQLWEDPSGKGSGRNAVSGGVFADWREQCQAFQQVAALWGIEGNLTGSDQPERLSGAQVSASFFELLRVRPSLGRAFLPEEGQPGHERVVILDHAYPIYKKAWGVTILPLNESMVGEVRLALLALMGAVSFVLLIACVNVANLILVRTAGRRRELSIRAAIGASRWRLVRQLLTESLTLALGGGALGVLLAFWGRDLLVALSPQDIPRLEQVRVDGGVLAFSLALSLLTGILCGLGPAWNASKSDLNEAMKEGGRNLLGGTRQRLSRGLVVVEVALALVLLVGAGLFLRSFDRLHSIDPGFKPNQVLTMQLRLPEAIYPDGDSTDRFFRDALERIEALPGVKSAGVCTSLPFFSAHDNGVKLADRPNTEYFGADYDFATPRYFRVLGIPLLKGRPLTASDRGASPRVALVNEAFVRKCLPGDDPIGKRFVENGVAEMEIVGVVGDVRGRSLALPSCSSSRAPPCWPAISLLVERARSIR